VRGKAGKNVGFGSKISISLVADLECIDYLSWEAFNESQILTEQVEACRASCEYWPDKVAVSNIYGIRENRLWCK
jgi:IS5 family transposase